MCVLSHCRQSKTYYLFKGEQKLLRILQKGLLESLIKPALMREGFVFEEFMNTYDVLKKNVPKIPLFNVATDG